MKNRITCLVMALVVFMTFMLSSCNKANVIAITPEGFKSPESKESTRLFYKPVIHKEAETLKVFDATEYGVDLTGYWCLGMIDQNKLVFDKDSSLYLLTMDTGEMKQLIDLGGECTLAFMGGLSDRYLTYLHSTDTWWGDCFVHLYDFETGEDKIIFERTLVSLNPIVIHDGTVYFDDFAADDGTTRLYNYYSYDIETETVTKINENAQYPVVYNGSACRFEFDAENEVPVMVNSQGEIVLSLIGNGIIAESGGGTIAFTNPANHLTLATYCPEFPGTTGDSSVWGDMQLANLYSILHNDEHIPLFASSLSGSSNTLGRMYTDGRYCVWGNAVNNPVMYYDIEKEVFVRFDVSLPAGRYRALLGVNGPMFIDLDTSVMYLVNHG